MCRVFPNICKDLLDKSALMSERAMTEEWELDHSTLNCINTRSMQLCSQSVSYNCEYLKCVNPQLTAPEALLPAAASSPTHSAALSHQR